MPILLSNRLGLKRLFALLPLLAVFSCGDLASNAAKEVESMPTEQKLAVLDADGYVDTADIKVRRIKFLLHDLAGTYNEPVDSIAEWTHRTSGVLKEKGVGETNLNVLEEMMKAGKVENTPYRDVVTLYAMIRAKGF